MASKRVIVKAYYGSAKKLKYASRLALKYNCNAGSEGLMQELFKTAAIKPYSYCHGGRIEKITLAWYNGKVIGAAIKGCSESEYTFQVYVKKRYRKKGIGSRLVQRLGTIRRHKKWLAYTPSGVKLWESLANKDERFANMFMDDVNYYSVFKYDNQLNKYVATL